MGRFHTTPDGDVQFTQAEEDFRDAEEAKWADGKVKRDATKEIHRLEGTITKRRLRDALATDEGKTWVADVEDLIEVERGKL
jgi:hypothetical protein